MVAGGGRWRLLSRVVHGWLWFGVGGERVDGFISKN